MWSLKRLAASLPQAFHRGYPACQALKVLPSGGRLVFASLASDEGLPNPAPETTNSVAVSHSRWAYRKVNFFSLDP